MKHKLIVTCFLTSCKVLAFMENLFQLGLCFSDSATHVALQCFRTKNFELFSLFYTIPDDLELTVVNEKGSRIMVCTNYILLKLQLVMLML